MSIHNILILLLIGVLSGTVSGLTGIGGGIIVIPMLVFFLGYSQQFAQGTALAMLLPPIGLLAVINYSKLDLVDFKAAVIMVLTFMIGSYFSSKFAVKIPTAILQKIFAIFLFAISLYIFFKK